MKNAEFYCIKYVVTAIIVLFVFRRRARRRGRRRLRHDTHQVHRRNAVRSQIAIINNARTVQITTFETARSVANSSQRSSPIDLQRKSSSERLEQFGSARASTQLDCSLSCSARCRSPKCRNRKSNCHIR